MRGKASPSRIREGLGELPRPFGAGGAAAADEDPTAALEALRAEAFERGREQGRAEGAQEAEQTLERELERLHEELAATLRDLSGLEERMRREHGELMKELALEAASRMLRDRIEGDDPVALRALQQALDALPGGGPLRARLNPLDLERVAREMTDEIAARRVELSGDETIARGGCIVDGGNGTIDATLGTAERAIAAAVRDTTETV